MLNRAQVMARLPHAGTMCLLDAVEHWDADSIVCLADAPGSNHPLAIAQVVHAIAAAEYAAQAAALHGSLLDDGNKPREGMLAKLSGIELAVAVLTGREGPLTVRCQLVASTGSGCMYDFVVGDSNSALATGRLLVAFEDGFADSTGSDSPRVA